MRASICVLAPLVVRCGRAEIPLPGGCNLGPRPIDLHLRTLAAFGADVRIEDDTIVAEADQLRPACVSVRGPHGPSVTGTATALMAAAGTPGTSRIEHAALEPEIADLANVLIQMGAVIDGVGGETLVVDGVPRLDGVRHRLIGDRIEAATFLLAAACTRGSVDVTGIAPSHLRSVVALLSRAGADVAWTPGGVRLRMVRPLRGFRLTAAPFPAVPTDLQPLWTVLATCATGPSHITDTVFPERFQHLAELSRFGAVFRRPGDRGDSVEVHAGDSLRGTEVVAPDLRAAAALVLAGLAAEGTSHIGGIEHLDRGYEQFEQKLTQLGGDVERVIGASHAKDEAVIPLETRRVPACSSAA